VYSTPTAVDGTVYVGSSDGDLYALDAGTGSVDWQRDLGRTVESSPAVVDGTVYVGSSHSGRGGGVYALDAERGTVDWSHEASTVHGSPAVVDGTVYVGSSTGHVYALAPDETEGRIQSVSSRTTGAANGGSEPVADTPDECPECGASLAEYGDINFCPECGAEATR
jgi:outer membrane protein assembly factor BamB